MQGPHQLALKPRASEAHPVASTHRRHSTPHTALHLLTPQTKRSWPTPRLTQTTSRRKTLTPTRSPPRCHSTNFWPNTQARYTGLPYASLAHHSLLCCVLLHDGLIGLWLRTIDGCFIYLGDAMFLIVPYW